MCRKEPKSVGHKMSGMDHIREVKTRMSMEASKDVELQKNGMSMDVDQMRPKGEHKGGTKMPTHSRPRHSIGRNPGDCPESMKVDDDPIDPGVKNGDCHKFGTQGALVERPSLGC